MIKLLKKITFQEFYEVNEKVAKTSPMMTHYQSKNPLEKWLWKLKKKEIENLLGKTPMKNIVDFGCGDASLVDLIGKEVDYTGIDISPTQIIYAKKHLKKLKRNKAQIHEGDILNLKFNDNSFDAALVCDVAEHVLSPEKLFVQIKRVVKNNGHIIFCIPNEPLWQIARAISLKFPLRSPDHIYAIYSDDIEKNFPKVEKKIFLPISFSEKLSLIHIFLVRNVK